LVLAVLVLHKLIMQQHGITALTLHLLGLLQQVAAGDLGVLLLVATEDLAEEEMGEMKQREVQALKEAQEVQVEMLEVMALEVAVVLVQSEQM
tara:strand:- start:283 stop:561 length:279 start_codon:yes stop_codon:yes gene_type:complete